MICDAMHCDSQAAMEDDLHEGAFDVAEPDNIAKYRNKSIPEICKEYKAANDKLNQMMALFQADNPSMCIQRLRKHVADMDEATDDEKILKKQSIEDFNCVLSIRRMLRNNLQFRNWLVLLTTSFQNVPDANQFEELKQTVVDCKEAVGFKKAEILKRKADELDAQINSGITGTKMPKTAGSSSTDIPRPRGAAPNGKEWDALQGKWIEAKNKKSL